MIFSIMCNGVLPNRITQLGGEADSDLCLCDDQDVDGIESKFPNWVRSYWENLPKEISAKPTVSNSFILKYKTLIDSGSELIPESSEANGNQLATEFSPYMARLVKNERATSDTHWQNTRLLEFDCANTNALRYEAGDVLMLRPSNLRSNIQRFYETFAHLNLEQVKDSGVKVELNLRDRDSLCIPVLLAGIGTDSALVRTVGDLVEKYFDLNSKPRMSFFEMFAQLATDELEKGKLLEFVNAMNVPEGKV
jgi:sulfite reductase alpha subunit-like flavoprotein